MKKEKKLQLVKDIATLVSGVGVTAVILNAIRFTKNTNAGAIVNIVTGIGGAVISGMVSENAADYVEAKIDKLAESVKEEPEQITIEEVQET